MNPTTVCQNCLCHTKSFTSLKSSSSNSVAVINVKPVINAVLSNIAHKHVDRLPGRTVLCDMMIECLTIAQAQLGEEKEKIILLPRLMVLPSMGNTLELMIFPLLIPHIALGFSRSA